MAKDVCLCYFLALRLVKFTYDVVSSYLVCAYFSRNCENYEDRMRDEESGDVLCLMAIDFQSFLSRTLQQVTDQQLKLIVNFLMISGDFIEFVSSYRSQDSIIIETGYEWFAPIWKLLGQVKYLEATWEQMDALYGNFPYSWTQEIRINRQVRTYPGDTGKSALAQDEWLELNRKAFSNYPSVRTLDGMRHKGNYIGMTQRCKRFLETVYSAGAIADREVYRSGTRAKGHGQQEKKLLWEVIDLFFGDCVLLMNDIYQYFDRKLENGTVSALKK
jgi:hypothetical protein